MPKCGSSSIQTMLSSQSFSITNKHILYISIQWDGTIKYGEKLYLDAKKSALGYLYSSEIHFLCSNKNISKKNIFLEINRLFDEFEIIVLSSENWGTQASSVDTFFKDVFSYEHGFSIETIIYIRPQVEWFNSAWWQWGVWTDLDIDEWIQGTLSHVNWLEHIEKYQSLKWIDKVHVQLLDLNLIDNFLQIINGNSVKYNLRNKSSSKELLKFFIQNRQYRKDPDDSQIEFILNRWLQFPKSNTPWSLAEKHIKLILDYYTDYNKELITYLGNNSKDFLENPKWFEVSFYQNKVVSSMDLMKLDQDDRKVIIGACKEAIRKFNNHPLFLSKNISLEIEKSKYLNENEFLIANINRVIILDQTLRKALK